MKRTKRLLALLVCLLLVLGQFPITAMAASTLTITSPVDWDKVDRDNTTLRWTKVTGAANYKLTIVNNSDGGALLTTRNMSMGNTTSYNITPYLQKIPMADIPDGVKIWVGAYNSSDVLICSGVVGEPTANYGGITVSAKPSITSGSAGSITANSANLSVTVNKNYGSAIEDAGFYVGTSSNVSAAKAYSVSSVVNNGTMTRTITGLQPNTKYYYWAYAENEIGETISSRSTFTTKAGSATLSLSSEDVSLTYNSGRATVTVTASGSWSVSDPDYNVSASAVKDYDYEWLVVSTSGDKLYLTPKRPNWSASARSAEVTVTCGNQSKTVTVTQAKCGESAPTITFSRGSTAVSNGGSLGQFKAQTGDMEVSVKSTGVRRIVARLFNENGSQKYDEQVLTLTGSANESSKIALDMSDCTEPGKYKIVIYASNSATANDYFSQSPFSNGSATLYFTILGSVLPSGNKNFASCSEAKKMVSFSKSLDWGTVGTINYVEQYWSGGNDSYYYVGSNGYWTSDSQAEGKCTRAASAMALSYMGITALPKNFSPTNGPYAVYAKTLGAETAGNDNETLGYDYSISLSTFNEWYNRYANDTSGKYSPIVIHTRYNGGMHAFAIIGRDTNNPNYYYTVDSGSGYHVLKVKIVEVSGAIRVGEYLRPDGTKIEKYSSNYSMMGVWQYMKGGASCSHSWSSWSKTSDSQHKRTCSKCGEAQTGSHSWGTWGTIGTEQHQRKCSVCSGTQTQSHTWGSWVNHSDTQHKHTCTTCSTTNYEGHAWNTGVVTKEPTETSTGIRTYTCTDCGRTKTETIPPLEPTECDHIWGDWSRYNTAQHKRDCLLCGEPTYGNHDWDNGVVTKQPTTTSTGVRTYICYDCGGTKTETIPELGGTEPEPPVNPEPDVDADVVVSLGVASGKPGDTVSVELYMDSSVPLNTLGLKELTYDTSVLTFLGFDNYGALVSESIIGNMGFDNQNAVITLGYKGADVRSGRICDLVFRIADDAEDGDLDISMSSVAKEGSMVLQSRVVSGTVAVSTQTTGDLTGDDVVDMNDVVALLQHSIFPELYPVSYPGGVDFNRDGTIDMNDVVMLLQYSIFPDLYPLN